MTALSATENIPATKVNTGEIEPGVEAPELRRVGSLRLLFIVENDEPHDSAGGYYAIFKFAESMAALGHQVRIYATHEKGWITPNRNLTTVYRPSLPRRGKVLSKLDRILSRYAGSKILETEIKERRPDWILGVLTHSAIKAHALGSRHGIRVANFIYECPPWLKAELGNGKWEAAIHPVVEKLWEKTRTAYLGSDLLFPNSNLSRQYNSDWLEGKRVYEPIHPGIDADKMPLHPEPEGEVMSLNKDMHHLLYVGRISEGKNIDHLLAFFEHVRKPAMLHICGTGSQLEEFKAKAAGNSKIRFYGFVPDNQLWSLFRQCDLVVYPTSFEGFGMPPMQALYFGKPCVASDLPIFRSVYGSLLDYFPLGQIDALSKTVNQLLDDPERRLSRGRIGRDYVLKHFTWNQAARTIEKALKGYSHETTH
jgi:glycosyltransferase involved in cell wall biosynthesis